MTALLSYALFDTAIGRCALAWTEIGIVGASFPSESGRDEAAVRRRWPTAESATPTSAIEAAITAIQTLLAGEPTDLSGIALDLSAATEFDRRVYALARAIPPGETRTYGEIAAALGDPGAARAVGRSLGDNPIPIIVPCHRVLGAGGKLGGFSAPGGGSTKVRMLQIERARTGGDPTLFDAPIAVAPPRS